MTMRRSTKLALMCLIIINLLNNDFNRDSADRNSPSIYWRIDTPGVQSTHELAASRLDLGPSP
jgi:hypothetical protein